MDQDTANAKVNARVHQIAAWSGLAARKKRTMSELKSEEATALPSSSSPQALDQEQKVCRLWLRYVRRLKACLRFYEWDHLGDAIDSIGEVVGMLDSLAAVIKEELASRRRDPPKMTHFFPHETPEEIAFGFRLDGIRLKAWSFEVRTALSSAHVSLKIAKRMKYQNRTSYNWHADDLEFFGELGTILRRFPTKDRLYLIDTDRAYEAFTDGRLKKTW